MTEAAARAPGGILVLRRDNIGDLVCTTPLLRALRAQLPGCRIEAYVNRYNEPVLRGNPDLDRVWSYQKAKHRARGESLLRIHGERLKTLLALRRERFDWLLLPGGRQSGTAGALRLIAPRRVIERTLEDAVAGSHEVEQVCHLLVRMGLKFETPAARVVPETALRERLAAGLESRLGFRPRRLVGLHVSARKPSQRWPEERCAELIRRLGAQAGTACLLLWAPGSATNPLHPGDDEKAQRIAAALPGMPLVPVPTFRLDELIAALALCDRVVCADGGAMHLAAALGRPVVCLFGQSEPERWRPWGVPHELLQPASHNVADIMVEDVMQACARLEARVAGTG